MKTIKFFSVLSLALILAVATAVYATNKPIKSSGKLIKTTIKYEVNVHLQDIGNDLCNTYLVQVTDENGNPVAHPQVYVPGTSRYIFNETSSAPVKIRIASLILSNGELHGCAISLVTPKDIKIGQFLPGQTYWFDLYPAVVKEDILIQDGTETGINP
jgi:hypothetical protein